MPATPLIPGQSMPDITLSLTDGASVRLNAPTALLAEAAAADAPTRDTFLILQMTTIAGGVPFADANAQPAGAVGVSGSAPEQDAACAARAIEATSAKRK